MAAYRADIEIGVKGVRQLEQLRSSINLTATSVDSLNEVIGGRGGLVQSIQNYANNVARASKTLKNVGFGDPAEIKAIREQIRAIDDLNAATARQQALIARVRAESRQVTATSNAGYGQQTPALPPAMIRAQEIGQTWAEFFKTASEVGRDLKVRALNTNQTWDKFFTEASEYSRNLKAKSLNTSQTWDTFFTEASEYSRNLKAKSLNTNQTWDTFFTEASEYSRNLKAKSLNTNQTWDKFFTEASEYSRNLKAKSLNTKQSWNAFFEAAEELASDLTTQALGASGRARIRQAENLAAYQAAQPRETFGYTGSRPALMPAGFTSQDVRIKNLIDDQNKSLQISNDLKMKLDKISTQAEIQNIQRALDAELDAIELAAAKRKLEGDRWWATQETRLRSKPDVLGGTTASFAGMGGFRGRAGSAISSALIGGGFPLLFGQGTAAAAGGAIGGLAGGLLGGGFGFALSIVGTAIADAANKADTFNKSLANLNGQISDTSSTVKITTKDISDLAKQLAITSEEAVKLAGDFSAVGDTKAIKELAAAFGPVGGAATFEAIATAGLSEKNTLEAIDKLRSVIGTKAAQQLVTQLKTEGSVATTASLLDAVLNKSKNINTETAKTVGFWEQVGGILLSVMGMSSSIGRTAIQQGQKQRVSQVKDPNRSILDESIKNLRNFYAERDKLEKTYSARTKQPKQAPKNRTQELVNEFNALVKVGELEDQIRDLRFQGREKLALERELEKEIVQIQFEKNRALQQANYKFERQIINTIAEAKIVKATRENQDRLRDLEKQRADAYQAVLRGPRDEIRLIDARMAGKEREVEIELRIEELKREQTYLNKQQIEQYRQQLELLYQRQDAEEVFNLQQQVRFRGAGLQAGFIGPAGAAFEQQLTEGKSVERATQIAQLTQQLQLVDVQAQAVESSILGIGDAFGEAMTSGVAALVSGTQNAQQVFAAFLETIGQTLLQAASQMIATYVAIGIARIFAGLGGGGGEKGLNFADMNKYSMEGPISAGMFAPRAGGGPVSATRPYLVGERGPELFVPGTGGSVVPTNDLRAAMGAGPGSLTGAPVLNMSFETSTINGVEYVSRDQLEAAMAATRRQAARDGAQRGMTMTLDRLQQSPNTRRRVGF